MNSVKKKAGVLAASGLLALSLLAGGATTANWSDGISLSGAQITSGNLDIEKIDDIVWREKSFGSANFNGEISLDEYKIIPGDTIQGKQDLDVALEGRNITASFDVVTERISGPLYSEQNGISATFMVVDEDGFSVVPPTRFGSDSLNAMLSPEDVTKEVDGVKDYTFVVTVSFDENTPEQIRTQVQSDLGTAQFNLNQVRGDDATANLALDPLAYTASYNLSATTRATEETIAPGESAQFVHALTNTGNAPLENVIMVSDYGTQHVADRLDAGDTVNVIIEVSNVTADIAPTFEFFGDTDNGTEKLSETTKKIKAAQYSASVKTTSSYTNNRQTNSRSVTITHAVTNTSKYDLYDVVVSSDEVPNSAPISTIKPGDTKYIEVTITDSDVNWTGVKEVAFTTSGDDVNQTSYPLDSGVAFIDAGGEPILDTSDVFAIGRDHSCDIRNGGEVWCWGRGAEGQLGHGSKRPSELPVRAGSITDAVKVETGQYNSFAITSTGELWAWGRNGHGELGLGDNLTSPNPRKVNVPPVSKVSAKGAIYHSAILLQDGRVMVSGDGKYLGTNNTNSNVYREPVKSFTNAKDVVVAYYNIYVLNGDGTVWGTGNRGYQRINNYSGSNSVYQYDWSRIDTHGDVESISAMSHGGVYERANNELYGWGRNSEGQFGTGNTGNAESLTRLQHYEDARQVALGWRHVVMLKDDGTVWTNGYNNDGQLGIGNTNNVYIPTKVDSISGVTSVNAGYYSSSATNVDGRYAWGHNDDKNLGVASDSANVTTPQFKVR